MNVAMHEDPEPSLDEILASIRRIIAEEGPVLATPTREPVRPAETADNVLVLTRRVPVRAEDPSAPTLRQRPAWMGPAPEDAAVAEEAASASSLDEDATGDPAAARPVELAWSAAREDDVEPAVETAEPDLQRWEAPMVERRPVATPVTAAGDAIAPSAEDLDEEIAIVSPETEAAAGDAFDRLARGVEPEPHDSPLMPPPGRTLEDVVRELLRPLIKEWLDENLPGMVRARIDEEIERIARRRVR